MLSEAQHGCKYRICHYLKQMVQVTPTAVFHYQVCKAIVLELGLQLNNVLTSCKTIQLLHFTLQLGYSLVPGLLCPGLGHDLYCNLLTGRPVNRQMHCSKRSRTDAFAE